MSEDDCPAQNTRLARPALHNGHNSPNTDGKVTKSPKKGRKLYPELQVKSKSPKHVRKMYPPLENNYSGDEYFDDSTNDGDPHSFDLNDVYDDDSTNHSFDVNDVYDYDSTNQSALTTSDGIDDTDGKHTDVRQRGRPNTPKAAGRGKTAGVDATKDRGHKKDDTVDWITRYNVIAVVIGVLLIAVGGYMLIVKHLAASPVNPSVIPSIDYFQLFKPNYDKLKQKFPSQSARFWKIIGAPVKRVLSEPNPSYPAIIMLGVADGQSMLGTCLAKDVAKEINNVYKLRVENYINSEQMDQSSVGKAKLELDTMLISLLTTGNAVVLDHVEKMHPLVAILLHAYCDGDNAPFKNVTLILVVHLDKQFSDPTDKTIDQFLKHIWEPELGVDETPALQSRVANNVAFVTPEMRIPEHCKM